MPNTSHNQDNKKLFIIFLQLNWSDLCREFPVLHPAQLHYLLSQYLFPSSITQLPQHWTPSEDDAKHALVGGEWWSLAEH